MDSRREQHVSRLAVCLPPFLVRMTPAALPSGLSGLEPPARPAPGCVSCPVPGQQLSSTRVCDLWGSESFYWASMTGGKARLWRQSPGLLLISAKWS